MKTDEFKALTFVHFPFIERSFSPGDAIPASVFEEYADAAAAACPSFEDERGGHNPTAQEQIDGFLEFGSISDDPDASLHPDHIPVVPGKTTLAQLIDQAKTMAEELTEQGREVPAELKALAETDYQHILASGDGGRGGDTHAG